MTLAALLLAGVMAFLWLDARNTGNDAAFERDAAITERDAANVANIESNAQLQTTEDELADARAELETASSSADGSAAASPEEVQELKDQVDDLSAEVERLEDENATLAADLEAAQSTTTVAAEPADTTPPTTTVPTDPAPETTVPPSVDSGDVGEQIAGLFRRSVLGSLQELCLGRAVLEDLGEARVVEALASESPGDDEEFVESIRAALPNCNIDPSAVFG